MMKQTLLVALCLVAMATVAAAPASAQSNRPSVRIDEIVPNPLVNGTARISFVIPAAGTFNISIYSIDGSLITSLLDSEVGAGGLYSVTWDGRGENGAPVANGLYLCRIQFGRIVQASPIVIMR